MWEDLARACREEVFTYKEIWEWDSGECSYEHYFILTDSSGNTMKVPATEMYIMEALHEAEFV